MKKNILKEISESHKEKEKLLAILIDPEKFKISSIESFLKNIPKETTHFFIGGSSKNDIGMDEMVKKLKTKTSLPILVFPGDYKQLTPAADAVLFLSLLSGRNPEYLIGQQIKGASFLKNENIEIIPTAYLLIDGGNDSSVAKITETAPISRNAIEIIVNTALAGEYMGSKLVYLEAGSGAKNPVSVEIIKAVKKYLSIPLIVGGGIRTQEQKERIFRAGADMIVMGTVFESQD